MNKSARSSSKRPEQLTVFGKAVVISGVALEIIFSIGILGVFINIDKEHASLATVPSEWNQIDTIRNFVDEPP